MISEWKPFVLGGHFGPPFYFEKRRVRGRGSESGLVRGGVYGRGWFICCISVIGGVYYNQDLLYTKSKHDQSYRLQDSNLHGSPRQILSLMCLPTSPRRRMYAARGEKGLRAMGRMSGDADINT